MNSQEPPVKKKDSNRKHAMLPKNALVWVAAKERRLGGCFEVLYWAS